MVVNRSRVFVKKHVTGRSVTTRSRAKEPTKLFALEASLGLRTAIYQLNHT